MQSQPDITGSSPSDSLHDLLNYRCSGDEASMLVAPFSAEEIHQTLLSLPNGKVPGPDGYTKEFFVAVWPIVGRDFTIAIQSFFQFGFLPTGVNATILALIPKKNPAQTMKDFRPIACCNLMYKIISKLLSSRLKRTKPNQTSVHSSRVGFCLKMSVLLISWSRAITWNLLRTDL